MAIMEGERWVDRDEMDGKLRSEEEAFGSLTQEESFLRIVVWRG